MKYTKPVGFILLVTVILAACASTAEPVQTPSAESPATQAEPSEETMAEGATLEEDATAIMDSLISFDPDEARTARETVLGSQDPRFIPVLIELMRAAQIGLVEPGHFSYYINNLERLSGQDFGDSWPAWVEWYGGTELEPPPGFTGWKGQLLGRIDPRFAGFLRDSLPSDIRVEEIQWGGVVVDGIPALDNPDMLPAAEADYLLPEEPVFGLFLQGEARAYPLRILDWHEMANDVIGGQPVSLAYCTLCGAAIAFDGQASDGETYTFGSSGFLFRSNKLMYDRQTQTLWNQISGEPVLGELVGEAVQLEILPVVLTSWADWQAQHPDTLVVDINTGYERVYTPGAAYGHYFSAETTMFPVWQRSDLLETKDQIFALRLEGQAKAYPLETLLEQRVVNDVLGETEVVLVAQSERVLVDANSLRAGPVTYSAGAEVRAFAREGVSFTPGTQEGELLDDAGGVWLVTEDALIGPGDARLERLGGHLAYWFGWYAFFPDTEVYGVD